MLVGQLENAWVRLEPLAREHVYDLLAAAADRRTFGLSPVPRDADEARAYIERALADADARRAVPFAIRRRDGGAIVGSTRFMTLEWWSWPPGPIHVTGEPRRADAGDPPDAVEIGHTWLAASAQRTEVNTAAKLLLMTHAFEVWRVHRLTLKTDARNERSRAAIVRVGGHFEGVLRAYQPAADGIVRDTAMFSVIQAEWPAVKKRLEAALLNRQNGALS